MSATPARQNEGSCCQAPRLPRKAAAPPATSSAQARRQSQPSAISATPATQAKVDVTKCHACHGSPATSGAQARHQSQKCYACHACHAAKRKCGCLTVPCLPRKTKVNVAKCHSCHVKRRWLSPSATPARQSAAASPPAHACHAKCRGVTSDQRRPSVPPEPAQCHKCPLPGKCHVHVAKYHACHAKQRPRLPRKTSVDVAECYTFHAKRRWMSPSATPAMQSAAASPATSGAQAPGRKEEGKKGVAKAVTSRCKQSKRLRKAA